MHHEYELPWRERLDQRFTELFLEYMPDRYVVDDDGWADWMAKPCEILMQEFGKEILVEAIILQEKRKLELPSREQGEA